MTDEVVTKDKRTQDASAEGGDAAEPTTTPDGAEAPSGAQDGASAEAASPTETAPTETASAAESVADAADVGSAGGTPPVGGFGAELEALRNELDERLRDLQRVSAEYANYRKRVERDRAAVVEQAMALVISSLLPILDDLDRAREHDDLVGPFASVAEQLNATVAKFGLSGFGEAGDAFDPTRHEAVAHQTSADVTAPTCVSVMRRGYLLGDRLLRAALVSVADPE